MARAWNRTLTWLIDRCIKETPSLEGSIRMMDFKVHLEAFPVKKEAFLSRRVLCVAIGAVVGKFVLSSFMVGFGLSPEFAAFLSASVGAIMGGLPSFERSVLNREEAKIRLSLMAEVAHGRIEALSLTAASVGGGPDPSIGRALLDLKRASREHLEAAAEALLIEASNSGYEGLDGSNSFSGPSEASPVFLIWSSELRKIYDTFGHYEDGDKVIEERPPVIKDGEVLDRGMVRRAGR